LIVSEKESVEKDLDEFIKEKWNKAEENRKVMINQCNQELKLQVSTVLKSESI